MLRHREMQSGMSKYVFRQWLFRSVSHAKIRNRRISPGAEVRPDPIAAVPGQRISHTAPRNHASCASRAGAAGFISPPETDRSKCLVEASPRGDPSEEA